MNDLTPSDKKPNYGTLERDDSSTSPFLTEVGTLRKLYRHPPCEICGIRNWSYNPVPPPCSHHLSTRRERNDNE